jgi:NAD(P)-dependent dehydrogenase (short-subunit alcohol dehydrogenase family)
MEKKKVALITGANRGIGFELARQLGDKGWKVYVGARTQEKAEGAVAKLVSGVPLVLDVSVESSIAAAAKLFSTHEATLDLLVNNAAILVEPDHNALTFSKEELERTFATNTLGPLLLSQAFAPLLIRAPGSQIINVSSEYGCLGAMKDSHAAAYRISKTALNAVTRVLAADLALKGVRVNSICPGWVRTAMGTAEAELDVETSVARMLPFILDEKKISGGFFQHGKPLAW